jgi:integrase/recombinase XerD
MTVRHGFRSRFGHQMRQYLALKRALGRKYCGEEQTLRHLDRFLEAHFPGARDLSVEILDSWLQKGCRVQPRSRVTHLTRVRQFCLFRRRTISQAFVPDRRQHATIWPNHVSRRPPTILSHQDVAGLLRAAKTMPGPVSLRETLFNVLLLLYATGLRRSEAVRLRVGDVDLDQGTLLVRETKFFKTRLVPVSASVLEMLKRQIRSLHGRAARPSEPLFQLAGQPLDRGRVTKVFSDLMRAIGRKPLRGRAGPRLHDLRATFAVHRLEHWYVKGIDVQSRLPALATYLGHKSIISTQYYVTATAEMLRLAARRFERACAPGEEV